MAAAVNRRELLALGLAASVLGSASACAASKPTPVPSDDSADPAVIVYIGDNFYEPEVVNINAGQAVRWEWIGREQHDVVASDRSFVSELKHEGSYTHIFQDAGNFQYICSVHPEMRGLVEVQ